MKKIKLEQFLKGVEINAFIVIWYEEERTLYDYEQLTTYPIKIYKRNNKIYMKGTN